MTVSCLATQHLCVSLKENDARGIKDSGNKISNVVQEETAS